MIQVRTRLHQAAPHHLRSFLTFLGLVQRKKAFHILCGLEPKITVAVFVNHFQKILKHLNSVFLATWERVDKKKIVSEINVFYRDPYTVIYLLLSFKTESSDFYLSQVFQYFFLCWIILLVHVHRGRDNNVRYLKAKLRYRKIKTQVPRPRQTIPTAASVCGHSYLLA